VPPIPLRHSRLSRSWRIFNTLVILFGFIGPWLRGCDPEGGPGPELSGFELARVSVSVLSDNWQAMLRELASPDNSAPLFLGFLVCALGFCAYGGISLIQAITGRLSGTRRQIWRVVPLAIGILSLLGVSIYWRLMGGADLLWGYWLTWAGSASSLAAEAYDARHATRRNKSAQQSRK
jgi:hypothetical protein